MERKSHLTRTIEELATKSHECAKGAECFKKGDLEEAFDYFDAAIEDFRNREDEDSAEEAEWVVNEIDALL